MKLSLSLLSLGILMTCCAGQSEPDYSTELLETDRAFAARSLEVGAAQAFHEYLHEEALMLSAGEHPITGGDNIFEKMKTGSQSYELIWEPQRAEVAQSGELGWTWGKYEYRVTKPDSTLSVSHGKYLNIWRKDGDGNWKVLVDMGNSSPTPD